MNPAHWYRKCPTCSGKFGRGAGANGLARHSCDDPLVIELRQRLERIEKHIRTAHNAFVAYDRFDKGIDALRRASRLAKRR